MCMHLHTTFEYILSLHDDDAHEQHFFLPPSSLSLSLPIHRGTNHLVGLLAYASIKYTMLTLFKENASKQMQINLFKYNSLIINALTRINATTDFKQSNLLQKWKFLIEKIFIKTDLILMTSNKTFLLKDWK